MESESRHQDRPRQHLKDAAPREIKPPRVRPSSERFSRAGPTDRFGIEPESFAGYVIKRVIKRGGQGVVYEAIHEATNRSVAIKVNYESMRRDPTSRVRIAREVEVLSRIRHPNIVRLTDGGEVKGRFYFVTDYIHGVALDQHLTAANYSARDIVSLFTTICDAANAAHRRGVVHRDLKPSNILIDDQCDPHILDFGLAKLATLDEHTAPKWEQMTATGQFLGSLPWATPEQVEGESHLIDCRTDVYALGVMLYHALTNRFPYDVCTSTRAAMESIRRTKPQNLSTSDLSFDDDLQTIVLKCLSKEPGRRYSDAGELATELRRFLAGEPINAKRDSRSYMFAKTIRRHRAAAAGIALAAAMTVIYAITVTVLYRQATDARQSALTAAARERSRADAQHETIEFMVDDVSSGLAHIPGAIKARRLALEGAYQRLSSLDADSPDNPRLQAVTLGMLGDILQALGDYDGALAHVRKALGLYEAMSKADPENPDRRADLSIALVRVGDVLGDLEVYAPRRALYERALAIDEALVTEFPLNRHYRDNLLWSYERIGADSFRKGDLVVAQGFFQKQRAVAEQLAANEPENSTRAFAIYRAVRHLDNTVSRLGDREQSQTYVDELVTLATNRTKRHPLDAEARFQLTAVFQWAGNHAAALGQTQKASEFYQRALQSHQEDIAAADDDRRLLQLARIYSNLGQMRLRVGDMADAVKQLRAALSTADRLLRLAPHAPKSQMCVFLALRDLIIVLEGTERDDAAQIYFDRATHIGEHILEQGRAQPDHAAIIAEFLVFRPPSEFRNEPLMIRTLEGVISGQSDEPTASHALLALLYHARGDTPLAIHTLKSALAKLPAENRDLRSLLFRALDRISADEFRPTTRVRPVIARSSRT